MSKNLPHLPVAYHMQAYVAYSEYIFHFKEKREYSLHSFNMDLSSGVTQQLLDELTFYLYNTTRKILGKWFARVGDIRKKTSIMCCSYLWSTAATDVTVSISLPMHPSSLLHILVLCLMPNPQV